MIDLPNSTSTVPRRVLIGVSGGIAAYKICQVVSSLAKAGADVRVILTDSAQQFVTPLTFATLARQPAYSDQTFWQQFHGRPLHIQLGEWAEVFLIAPLTANTLAKLAMGMADNLLTNTVLASSCPVLLVPAMNRQMWQQKAVQRNWQQLLDDRRFQGIAPVAGILACDRPTDYPATEQLGRMAEPEQILAHLNSLLHTNAKQDLTGKQILVSAGGTREYFDPVRFLGNPSTGKMGIAVVQAAVHRGASVTLVHAPMQTELIDSLPMVHCVAVTSAAEMHAAILQEFPHADITVMTAAVADLTPTEYYSQKVSKQQLNTRTLLQHTADILAELGRKKQLFQQIVGFAAQTGEIVAPAIDKLKRKNLDAIVANPIDKPLAGFGSETNQAIFIHTDGRQQEVARCSKLQLAHQLFDFVLK
ncbi:MAG: bifunctional phosphopantothenoylcysteine decarboxylase/phosphopantothenate--cysteine ligase CoaBC [Microcoleaceae cyanobacterium]